MIGASAGDDVAVEREGEAEGSMAGRMVRAQLEHELVAAEIAGGDGQLTHERDRATSRRDAGGAWLAATPLRFADRAGDG